MRPAANLPVKFPVPTAACFVMASTAALAITASPNQVGNSIKIRTHYLQRRVRVFFDTKFASKRQISLL